MIQNQITNKINSCVIIHPTLAVVSNNIFSPLILKNQKVLDGQWIGKKYKLLGSECHR